MDFRERESTVRKEKEEVGVRLAPHNIKFRPQKLAYQEILEYD